MEDKRHAHAELEACKWNVVSRNGAQLSHTPMREVWHGLDNVMHAHVQVYRGKMETHTPSGASHCTKDAAGRRTPRHENNQTHFVPHENSLPNKSSLHTRRKNTWNARCKERGKVAKIIDRVALLRIALSRHLSCQNGLLRTRRTPLVARLVRGSQLHSGTLRGTCSHLRTKPNVRPPSHGIQKRSCPRIG